MPQTAKPAVVFKPAVLSQVPLLIGLVGGTGSGKTFTAMRLASGISGGKRFAVIDSEAGRATHYANRFAFDHADIAPPFRPQTYLDAILAADAAGYPVAVVDSMSHVWAGEGGVIDWHDEELDRMAGEDWKRREACNLAAWIKPKTAHKAMVQRLLQIRMHVILCFRAEEKVDMVRDEKDGKMKIVPKKSLTGLDGWAPICEKSLPFELTASILLTADKPGYPKPIKLEEQHRPLFPLDKPISEQSGEQIAAWAAGTPPAAVVAATPPTVAEYEDCETAAALTELERRRLAHWKSVPTATKPLLKTASDAATARIKTATEDPSTRGTSAATSAETQDFISGYDGATDR